MTARITTPRPSDHSHALLSRGAAAVAESVTISWSCVCFATPSSSCVEWPTKQAIGPQNQHEHQHRERDSCVQPEADTWNQRAKHFREREEQSTGERGPGGAQAPKGHDDKSEE